MKTTATFICPRETEAEVIDYEDARRRANEELGRKARQAFRTALGLPSD